MTYEEFVNYVRSDCAYETIYDDSEGRPILVIRLLDAYGMVNKAKRTWEGLTPNERSEAWFSCEAQTPTTFAQAIESILKAKNAHHN